MTDADTDKGTVPTWESQWLIARELAARTGAATRKGQPASWWLEIVARYPELLAMATSGQLSARVLGIWLALRDDVVTVTPVGRARRFAVRA